MSVQPAPTSLSIIERFLWWSIAGIATAGYILLVFWQSELPYLDLPNHLARAAVIRSLVFEGGSSPYFRFEFQFTPYIFGDLLLASLIHVMGVVPAALTWITTTFLSLPLALSTYARARRLDPSILPLVFFAGIYLGTNWFVLSAYANFCLGVSTAFFALACFEKALPRSVRTGPEKRLHGGWWLVFALLSVLTYVLHLAAALFLGVLLACLGLFRFTHRDLTRSGLALSLFPISAVGAWHIAHRLMVGASYGTWVFRSPWNKLTALGAAFYRFDLHFDLTLLTMFLVILLLAARWSRTNQLDRVQPSSRKFTDCSSEYTLAAGALLAIYAALPVAVDTLSDIDGRAIPFITCTLLIGACCGRLRPTQVRLLSIAGLCLALLNLAYLRTSFAPHQEYLRNYHVIRNAIPSGAKVFPVNTRSDDGRIHTSLHSAALAVVEHHALVPYILSSLNGEPVTYFHYRLKTYTPLAFWYIRGQAIDWSQVLRDYDYVLVTKPVDPTRLAQSGLQIVMENSAAVLFRTSQQDGMLPEHPAPEPPVDNDPS
ncbi:MAG: hypothetical protein KDD44_01530 [Bdellovibrionales bacterium]|nr:hypothetical protein [Bdellovibrionales bacterium]